jgi:hypothetical protein
MAYELAPVPIAMFGNDRMRISTIKASLENQLKVEIPSQDTTADVTLLDGCAVLWVVPWSITVQQYLDNFRTHLDTYLIEQHCLFDRYEEGSITESTRSNRDRSASRVYTFHNTS